jgi:methylenetetrahydrofolate dehydrogenase (NADP+)/methenyltetrahydrofolate cyclohydrolase
MSARILDGTALAQKVRARLTTEVEQRVQRGLRAPKLQVILVGDDPASAIYVRNKEKAAAKAGIEGGVKRLPENTSSQELHAAIEAVNADEGVDGLLVQLPLPAAIDPAAVRSWIDPTKDVDGLHPENVGLLASGTPRFVPCTPAGCLALLKEHGIEVAGRRALVIGRSLIVGRPMATLLSQKGVDATVTIYHSRSRDLKELASEAEIIVAAAGTPMLLKPEHVKPGVVVVDVGIHRIEDPTAPKGTRLVGDVDPGVAELASWISPVPGGVGPMTIAMLLANTVLAHGRKTGTLSE